ncbi:C-GCAxxG-C-C family protein [Dehalogenimonas sp. THU2]|uniref:C-GCAxxG-C-C family protein n=1 Tax=Dehalogenimonas sp. THU2 TaxID=3151121 RepID=UPI003218D62D
MNRAETAYSVMAESKMNCAQAVVTAFCEDLGLDVASAMRLARGFGGGMGRGGKTCGAVSGACIVLGLAEPLEGREGIEAVYVRIGEFNRRFVERFNSTECNALLGCDISTPVGLARARAEGYFKQICPGFVKGSVEILEESLG